MTTTKGSCTLRARAIPISYACVPVSPRGRPTPWSCRTTMPRCAPYSRSAREPRSRSCPFGGGTSVVGGLAPLRGEHGAVVALDMRRMAGMVELDGESRTVTVQAGMRAPALERFLASRALTLGHFPQSFEYVSLGGCAATRSAGQASSGYGAIERMVLGLRLAAPSGEMELPAVPATAAGPGLRQLLVGSEGTLGVITELALRVRPAPRERVYEGVFFESFDAGVQALRSLAQQDAAPDVARLSDEQETRISLALAGSGGLKGGLGRLYLGMRGYRDRGVLAILGFEGAPEQVAGRRRRALELVRRGGGLAVGRSPGERRGSGGASTLPTCVTSCSRTG